MDKCIEVLGNHFFYKMYTLYTNIHTHTYIYESLTKAASSVLLVILSPGHSAPALALIWEFNKKVLNKHKCERTNHVLFTSHITIYIHVLVLTLVELEDIYLALNISMQIYRHGYAFIFNYRCCFVFCQQQEIHFQNGSYFI